MVERFFYNESKVFLSPNEYCALDDSRKPGSIIVELDDIQSLDTIPAIDTLIIQGGNVERESLKSLYHHPEIRCLMIDYYETEGYSEWTIDISKLCSLEILVSHTSYGFANIQDAKALRALVVTEWYQDDLSLLEGSSIESLIIGNGKRLKSLSGFSGRYIKVLQISHSPITEISELSNWCRLELLEIDHCHRIQDWNGLTSERLMVLLILGNNTLPSISFVDSIPCLQSLVFEGTIRDGNLMPLKRLSRCIVSPHRKCYNVSREELQPVVTHKTELSIRPEFNYYKSRTI